LSNLAVLSLKIPVVFFFLISIQVKANIWQRKVTRRS
jgi:hypothetical protein